MKIITPKKTKKTSTKIKKIVKKIVNKDIDKTSKSKINRVRYSKNDLIKDNYYINPKELIVEIKLFKENGVITNKLGEFILKIAKRFASRPNFSGYTYKDDFINDAVLRMVEQLDKIKLDIPNSNPFAYLTQICYNSFISKIQKEKKYSEVKNNLAQSDIQDFENSEHIYVKKLNDVTYDKHSDAVDRSTKELYFGENR